ncbi:MAG: hypothetical protein ISQ22_09280 [Rhizobiales bacterium]|nr:hypothetical protein [Hyphomicrobiales bacterium]
MATTSKNAYEIRSDLLGLAKSLVEFNYQVEVNNFEYKVRKDGDQVVTEFKAPTVSPDDIIETAKKFNDFVTNGDTLKEMQGFGQKLYEEGLKNSKPFAEAYQNTVKAFFPHLNGQSK